MNDSKDDLNTNKNSVTDLFGDVIYAYTRAQALEYGDLVDASAIARRVGFRIPVAVTRAIWIDCVYWDELDTEMMCSSQDESGRLLDLMWMTRYAIRNAPPGVDRIFVDFIRVRNAAAMKGRKNKPHPVQVLAVCSPGDTAEPVLTIMFPSEI